MFSEIGFHENLKETISRNHNGDWQFSDQFRLTIPHHYTLKHINNYLGVSLTTLGALMLNDTSSTTHQIRIMQEEALVLQRQSESDRRTYYPFLSDSGKQIFQHASRSHDANSQDHFPNRQTEVEAPFRALVVITNSLERELKQED